MRVSPFLALALGFALWTGAAGSGRAAQPLNLFIWSEYLDPALIKAFEERHDAKVSVDFYEDAESMLAKLQAGGAQFDVIVPPDHTVPVMVKLGLLSPLRKERIPNFKNLERRFVAPSFDPKNEFTVAFQWGTLGIFYRKTPGKPAPDSWAAFFDPAAQPGPIVLIDSMRDAIGSALKFRGFSMNSTDTAQIKTARDLLSAAKPRSVAFEGSVGGRNRVMAKTASVAMVYSSDAVRGMAEDPGTGYVIPKEGSEIWLDSLAIPAKAPHQELAEKFINYLLEPQVGARISEYSQGGSPNAAAKKFIKPADLANAVIYPPPEVMGRLEFLDDVGSKTRLYDQAWTQVKAK